MFSVKGGSELAVIRMLLGKISLHSIAYTVASAPQSSAGIAASIAIDLASQIENESSGF